MSTIYIFIISLSFICRAELAMEKDQRRILADDVKRLETQQAVSSKQRE